MEQQNDQTEKGKIMYAEKLILETDLSGKLKKVPKLPPNTADSAPKDEKFCLLLLVCIVYLMAEIIFLN